MYITLVEYGELYSPMDEALFKSLSFDAFRVMDLHTTGIDNVNKLQKFFPSDEYDAEAVRHCAAKIINLLHQIHKAEIAAMEASGYESTAQGMRGKVISSISAGNESISYAAANSSATAVDAAVKDKTARSKLLADTVRDYLRGVSDANGVNLLYMGRYPGRFL